MIHDFFSGFGELFGGKKKKPTYMTLDEVVREYLRQEQEFRQKHPRPKYHPGKGTYYGSKIYGMEPGDWKQTKPPATEKKLDLNKGKWKPQFTIDDVVVIDIMQTSMNNIVRLVVRDLFVIDLVDVVDRFVMSEHGLSFNENIDKHTAKAFVELCIIRGLIPTPMEELL